jgi:tripartite-type tricarboxylate transporter receptor subunit TctC
VAHTQRAQRPDGYTLFANSIADAQNLYFIPVPYNAIDDFAMIGMIVEGPPLVLIVDTTLPYKSLAELLADAKVNPNRISFGTSGPATVRRQSFRDGRHPDLVESLAHAV